MSLSLCYFVFFSFSIRKRCVTIFIFLKKTECVAVVSRHVTNDAVADNVSEYILG